MAFRAAGTVHIFGYRIQRMCRSPRSFDIVEIENRSRKQGTESHQREKRHPHDDIAQLPPPGVITEAAPRRVATLVITVMSPINMLLGFRYRRSSDPVTRRAGAPGQRWGNGQKGGWEIQKV